ncbi:hypothetical protein ACH9DO_13750 [Kocuria sp. M1N1S27]|uniref:hypothetical protein n=1 Tax=Kocuria kalidii TaxID=3376283 RepID=UPI0037B16A15
MTAVKKWVAAGSSAAVLTGGLFLGAPAAHAADESCVAGTTGAYTSVGDGKSESHPVPSDEMSQLFAAAAAVNEAGVYFNSLVSDPQVLEALVAAQAQLESSIVHSGSIVPAQDAWNTILGLQADYAATAGSAEVTAAHQASLAAAAEFEAAARASSVVMEDGADLMAMFDSALAACGGTVPAPGAGTDTGAWSDSDDSDDWAGAGTGSGVNQGINMQTAGEGGLSTGVLAGLLAAGAAVSGAVAFRLRRRHA